MTTIPERGQRLPDVEFITESGERLGTGDLDGKTTGLYFYAKDATSGCTKETCTFRDPLGDYEEANITVYGVCLDAPDPHRPFREKHNLIFPLLTDEGGRAAEALEVLRETREKANRVTFLLGPDGRIARVYPEVSPETHADEILHDAASL